jgi:hypothetical protein
MDSAAIAAAAVASNQAQLQLALAAKFAKMNAASQQSLVALLEQSSANLEQLSGSALAPGVGGNVDVSA